MHDGKALQSGTSHNFGDGFAKRLRHSVSPTKTTQLQYVHQTSWGMTTRMIGAIIMVHGDNSGLVLPPRIAPDAGDGHPDCSSTRKAFWTRLMS